MQTHIQVTGKGQEALVQLIHVQEQQQVETDSNADKRVQRRQVFHAE